MPKTYEEINGRIRKGEAVVLTAEEIIDAVEKDGLEKTAKEVDVVTTATFGPMCSSGAMLNTGHSNPKMKMQKAWLNEVNAYAGIAAVDLYLGAAELQQNDPANNKYPGEFNYGGGHVIEDLIAGKDVLLKATSYGTDCYPRKELESWINIGDLNEAVLVNPRNGYQNYNVAVNQSEKTIYTYMGKLLPKLGNANYCSAGQLSPLLNDPFYKTIGIGTRVFLGGAQGYVYWQGTQHCPTVARNKNGVPMGGAGTLAVVGDMKQMSTDFIRGVSMTGYGVSLAVGLGIPIPILDEEILKFVSVKDSDILAPVVDYSHDYPNAINNALGMVSYEELKSGKIQVNGKELPTGSLSSYRKAREIAAELKKQVSKGEFLLQEPIQNLPLDTKFKSLKMREGK
ncbi:MAG: homocysteine biosynthesis protein [Candidatus Diapherotrites archaeon]